MGLLDTIRALFTTALPPETAGGETTEAKAPSAMAAYGWSPTSLAQYVTDRGKVEQTRIARYRDYDKMDECAELSSALDIYASNSTSADREPFTSLAFDTEDEPLKETLEAIAERIGARDDIWTKARDLAKYGDEFEEQIFDGQKDLVRVKSLDRFRTFRNDDAFGRLPREKAYYQAESESAAPEVLFDDWQVVHYRLRRTRGSRYGTGLLASARRVFKQLDMMEDGLVITRLSRATMRYAFMVDVGGLRGQDALDHLKGVRDTFKKRRFLNAQTGQLELQDNPLTQDDDLWLPQGETGKSDAKVLQGQANLGEIADVEYFRNKLFIATKVPKAYLGLEAETRARAVMTELDVQFARSVRRVQLALAAGDKQVFDGALALRGILKAPYGVLYPPISTVDELREWQVEKTKAEIAKIWGKDINEVSTPFLLKKYLGLTDDDIAQMTVEPKPVGSNTFYNLTSKSGDAADSTPTTEEVYAHAHLANALETLRDLVDMELDGTRYARAVEPVRRGRRVSLPSYPGGSNGSE